jgi:hypothetical protein
MGEALEYATKQSSSTQKSGKGSGVNLNELFERMTREELEEYARDGKLPGWFTSLVGATAFSSQEAQDCD